MTGIDRPDGVISDRETETEIFTVVIYNFHGTVLVILHQSLCFLNRLDLPCVCCMCSLPVLELSLQLETTDGTDSAAFTWLQIRTCHPSAKEVTKISLNVS